MKTLPGDYLDGSYTEVIKSTVTDVEYVESTIAMWQYFQSNIMNALERSNFAKRQ